MVVDREEWLKPLFKIRGGIMDKASLVKELISDVITSNGYRLDDVLYLREGNSNFLRVVIDKDGIITVDDCSRVTRLINPILDSEDPIEEGYILDVCSMEKGE